jgi:hypothetical protein
VNLSDIITRNIANIPGWHTNKKFVVIESDDWGSIRMPSLSTFEKLEKSGLDLRSLDAERYNRNDSFATNTDLESLFQVLSGFKDGKGNNAVFTAISVVANPDFEKIRKNNFNEYFYEPFTETLKRYPGCERSFELWKEGIEKRLFVPQMHGREHLNIKAWIKALKNGDRQTCLAFDEGIWGFVPNQLLLPDTDFQAAFLLSEPEEIDYQRRILTDGLILFKKLFGYKAEYFVPPNGSFNNNLNLTLTQNGVKFRSAPKIQSESIGFGKTKKVIHWLGQKDKSGIRYITRNCFFEPSQQVKDWVDSCLRDIKIAFIWHKPAIISSHRVNYIGALNSENRDRGLNLLKVLLQSILKNWPDVEFLTTPELGKLIEYKFYE